MHVIPVESTSKDEVVVRGEFLEPCIELSLIDKSTGFVDDD